MKIKLEEGIKESLVVKMKSANIKKGIDVIKVDPIFDYAYLILENLHILYQICYTSLYYK